MSDLRHRISPNTFDVLGLKVAVTNLTQASAKILMWSTDQTGRFICVRDVHGVMQSVKDAKLFEIHAEAAMITPDGMPLVALGRMAGRKVGRVCGADLMDAVIKEGVDTGTRHYFYGGKHGVAEQLILMFQKRYPDAIISGSECPPFRAQSLAELQATRENIFAARADIVWVGLSTPKQEKWMCQNYIHLTATLIGVGAAFDFHAGTAKRAPLWMQKSGFEWLHRLCSEPRRLWRRYLIMAPKFVFTVVVRRLIG